MNADFSTPSPQPRPGSMDRHGALFSGLVLQQAQLAAMFLGRVPHPDTGRTEINLEAATLFIDTLEALEARTRGNLSPDEAALLADTLTDLRLAFVQAAQTTLPPPARRTEGTPVTPSPPPPTAAPPAAPPEKAAPAERQEEEGAAGKRFVKRY